MQKNQQSPDLPIWFDGKNINEALFCQEFLREHRIIFTNRAFFTPDGRVTDDLPLRGEIYESLKSCAVNNIPKKISNILEVLKLEAQAEDLLPEPDRVVYLDLPTELAEQMMRRREQATGTKADIHERDEGYLAACRESAELVISLCGWEKIDCSRGGAVRTPEDIHREVLARVEDLLVP